MCGIAGVYQLNGRPVPTKLVESMGSLLNHRGPDNFGFLSFENLAMAHNRLSLLDLSAAANQPFKTNDYVLCYNGEIYNFREIRAQLERDYAVEFLTSSDTEVLCNSLIYNGVHSTLKQIKGMFAFSFYDKTNNELWLARDRLGIKPLYYFERDGGFYWSSELKALAHTLDIKPDPIKTLFSINGSGEKSSEQTLFNGISPVKPGSCLRIKSNAERLECFEYYQPLDDFDLEIYNDLNNRSAAEVLAEFEFLFERSIKSMLIADAPLGAFVSGGIDSSLIAAIARSTHADLKLFTANVVGKFSEYEDAEVLSKHLGAELFESRFEPSMMLENWAEVTYFYESPIVVHTNAIPFSSVAKLARRHRVKAVLTGEGADELFLGYPRLLAERYNRAAAFPVAAIKSLYKLIPGLANYLFPDSQPTVTGFVKQLVQNFETLQRSTAGVEKFAFLSDAKRKEQLLTIKLLGEHLTTLLYRNDRMGMMGSIEARFPFLNEDLVKFAINLPVKYKIAPSHRWHNFKHPFLIDKWMDRKTAEKHLPKKLALKRKNGFPMLGHKSVSIKEGFFKNGWVEKHLSLPVKTQKFLIETQDPYFVAKLASVEIFGKIFDCGESLGEVKSHILKNAEMIP